LQKSNNIYSSLDAAILSLLSKHQNQAEVSESTSGQIACMGKMINSYKTLVGKPEGRGPLRRPRYRWEILKLILGKQD
jgi:hypothetical protein